MATMGKILCILSVMATLIELCMAIDHTVGDTTGWDTASDIKTWASTQKYQVGDNLVFKYSSPMHSVFEVPKSDYDSCQSSNAIETHTGGSTTIALKSPGKRFFICGTAGHCDMGMKLEVETLATPAAATSPPPPKAALPPSAPKSSGAGSPPPSSTPKSVGSPPPSSPVAAPTGSRPPVIPPHTTPSYAMDIPTASPISPSGTKSPALSPVQSASPARGDLGAGLVVGWFVAVVMGFGVLVY